MDPFLNKQLFSWTKPFIRDQDLAIIFKGVNSRRYDAVKYAIAKGILIHVCRGVYLIGPPYKTVKYDPFELAQVIYGPSYISLESALSFHSWIPEAVYMTTSVSAKRSKMVETPVGVFRYSHTPTSHFFLNVERISNSENTFLVAEPWKAVADMIYCYKKTWKSISDLSSDLRIESDVIEESDRDSLLHVATYYDSKFVRQTLSRFLKEF